MGILNRGHAMTAGQAHIAYVIAGAGVPILFVPPPVVGASVFLQQMHDLSSSHQVIAVDVRGHGRSSPSDGPLTYASIADDIKCILDHAGIERAIICGYSMGGAVVLEFAKRYPQRMLGGVPISAVFAASNLRLRAEIATAIALAGTGAIRTLAFGLALGNANSLRAFGEMYHQGIHAQASDVKALFQYALVYTGWADLGRVDTPLRLLFGGSDKRLRDEAALLKHRLRHQDVMLLPGAGHQLPSKWSQWVNSQIRQFAASLRAR